MSPRTGCSGCSTDRYGTPTGCVTRSAITSSRIWAARMPHSSSMTPRPRRRAPSTVSEVITRAGGRWQVEEDNEINKQIAGLAQYQVRKWTPWHRHVTACMLATAFLSIQRAAIPEPDQTLEPEPDTHPKQAPDQGKAPSSDESEAAG
jgi:SRSO17 transposase